LMIDDLRLMIEKDIWSCIIKATFVLLETIGKDVKGPVPVTELSGYSGMSKLKNCKVPPRLRSNGCELPGVE